MVGLILRRGIVLAMALALATASASLVLAESPPPSGGPTVAGDDSFVATEDQVLAVPAPGLLANDNYGPDTCVVGVDFPDLDGVVVFHTDGSFEYTPPADFNGVTSFAYGIVVTGPCVDVEAASQGTVTITVAPVNDAPNAAADSFIVLKDRTLNVGVPGVLINDHDVDGDTLSAVKVTNPAHGVVVLASDGSFSYTPANNYTGPDAFSYKASDGLVASLTRVVSLTVKAIPPVPTPTPTPTPAPTATPEVTPQPSPSPSPEASPSAEPSPSAELSPVPSISPSPTPAASPAPSPTSGDGGVSLPVLLLIVLLLLLTGFGAALYVPKWLAARRGREPFDP